MAFAEGTGGKSETPPRQPSITTNAVEPGRKWRAAVNGSTARVGRLADEYPILPANSAVAIWGIGRPPGVGASTDHAALHPRCESAARRLHPDMASQPGETAAGRCSAPDTVARIAMHQSVGVA